MEKRLMSVLLVFFLTASVFCGTYSGGDGSAEYPYRISTPEDMNEIGFTPADWDANFVMVNDIDLTEYTAAEFSIIGSYPDNPFTGIFDGNSHSISNFTYAVTAVPYIGLFSFVDGSDALIKNLTLEQSSVTAATSDFVGALAGLVKKGSLIRCSVIGGSITADDWVGPLAGKTDSDALVAFCSSNTSVSGGDSIGGLVGENRGTISKSFATGTISGNELIGGLVGNDYMIVSDSFAAGSVTGANKVGGLIGRQNTFQANEKTENCFSATAVFCGGLYTGGFVGYEQSATSLFIGCFWNNEINPGLNGIGNTSDPNVNAIDASAMRDIETFTEQGWDFAAETDNGTEDIWQLQQNQSYPYLNLYPVGDLNTDGIVNCYDLGTFCNHWLEKIE